MTTDPSTDPTPTEPATDPDTIPAAGEPEPLEPGDAGKAAREAAKYRRQLRDTETERDGLRGTVEALQRAEVLRLAADKHGLSKPEAIFAAGATLADMIDADGRVDAALVSTAVTTAAETLGLTRTHPSHEGGARQPVASTGRSWSQSVGRHQQVRSDVRAGVRPAVGAALTSAPAERTTRRPEAHR